MVPMHLTLKCIFNFYFQSAVNSKLEKADILEMTVQYLERITVDQRRIQTATTSTVASPYQSGYTLCANQASNYLELNTNIAANGLPHSNRVQKSICSPVVPNTCENDISCRLSEHLNSRHGAIRSQETCPRVWNGRLQADNSTTFSNSRLERQERSHIFPHAIGNNDINKQVILNLNSIYVSENSTENTEPSRNNANEQLNNENALLNVPTDVWRPW